jgi:hypothetical protein
LRAFGIPELLIQALQNYVLVGKARVEVTGRKGILIMVRTGSGQGDPLSSILFLICLEPLNRLIVAKFAEIMYTTLEGIKVGPILFAEDNLSPTKLQRLNNWIQYKQYTIDTLGSVASTSISGNPQSYASTRLRP